MYSSTWLITYRVYNVSIYALMIIILWSDVFCDCVNGLSDYNIVLIEDRQLWFKGDEHLKNILVTI